MKKTLISLAFVLSSLVSAPAITLGVYDNAQTMTGKALAYEEVFVDQTTAKGWVGTNEQSVYDFATAASAKGRTPIISIEPSSGDPLNEIVSGKRDKEIANICSQLAQYGGPAIIRFGHEPESSRYPWGGNRPKNISRRTATSWIICANAVPSRNFPSCGPQKGPPAPNITQAHTTSIMSAALFLIRKTGASPRPLLPCTEL